MCKRSSLRSQCFMSSKTHNFAYCVLLSCPYWNSICVLVFLCQSRWGLWMMALFHPRSQGHIFKVIVEQQNSISFLVCVVYLYSVWRWKICCPVKWHFWYWVSVQDQKNGRILSCLCWQQQKIPRETSSLTSIFFSMMEFPKDFVIKLITEDLTHFNCKYTLNQNQNILKILIFQF